MQSHYGRSQKNNVLLTENVKIIKTIKQNKQKGSLTLILMNSWVI